MNKLRLQKFGEHDFDIYFSLVSDEKVMAFITERAIPLEEAKADFQKLLKRNTKYESFGSYKIYNDATGEFIGLGHLIRNEQVSDEAELGYMLMPKQWGKGYGSAIADILLQQANKENVKRIIAIIDPSNIPSRKILINRDFISEKVCEMDGLPGEILSKTLR